MKEYKYRINGSLYNVVVNEIGDENASVEVNGTPYTVELEKNLLYHHSKKLLNQELLAQVQ